MTLVRISTTKTIDTRPLQTRRVMPTRVRHSRSNETTVNANEILPTRVRQDILQVRDRLVVGSPGNLNDASPTSARSVANRMTCSTNPVPYERNFSIG